MKVIKNVGNANGDPSDLKGTWLLSFDSEAFDGRGHARWTRDVKEARQFDTFQEAFAFWQTVPLRKPLADDGKPNRPLMAFSVEILDA